jgi:NitT/TauT family transport system substrate-binding protein
MPTIHPDVRRISTRSLAVVTGMTFALSLAACSSAPTSSEGGSAAPSSATLQLGWLPNIENGVFVLGDEKGHFEDAGIDLEILPGGPDVTVDAQIVGGGALVGLMSTQTLADSVLNGAPLVGVAAVYQYSSTSLTVLADSGIEEIEDLAGKRIGVTTGQEVTLLPFLEWVGVDTSDIEIVAVDGSATPLVTDQVDALYTTLGNVPLVLETQGVETESFAVADYGYNRWSSILTVRKDSLEDPEKREQIQAILRGSLASVEEFVSDPEAAGEVVYDAYGEQLGLEQASQVAGAVVWADLIERGAELNEGGLLEITEKGVEETQALFDDILDIDLDAATLFDLTVQEGILGE